jgi:hypothetical protein
VLDSQTRQLSARVCDSEWSAVRYVIPRERYCVETRPLERGQIRRVRTRRRHVPVQFCASTGVRNFQMTDCDIRRRSERRNAAQPMVRMRLIQHQVTGEYEVERCHSEPICELFFPEP